MAFISVVCPHCKSIDINKFGSSGVGKQRYYCKSCNKTFQWDYKYIGCDPSTRSKIYFQTINGSGTRAIARNLAISPNTVTATLMSFESLLWHVNYDYLLELSERDIEVEIMSGTEADTDSNLNPICLSRLSAGKRLLRVSRSRSVR